jgi:hypothetical protein
MTRKANRLVEKTAKSTSRRGFFSRIARLAGGAAFAVAGFAAGTANAAKGGENRARQMWCCMYVYEPFPDVSLVCMEGPCPKTIGWGSRLVNKWKVDDCSQCTG